LYSKEEIAKLVDSVDKNKDGLISIDEFSKLINN
jgi:Ca2+-binding EF-hand superfamily protein